MDETSESRCDSPSKSRGGVKGKLDALELRLGNTVDDLKDLSNKEADDKQFLLDRLQQLEDNLMGEIDSLRKDMNKQFNEVRDDCAVLSKRLTVQKGDGTAHAEQLKFTNTKLKNLEETMTILKKEVDGDDSDEE